MLVSATSVEATNPFDPKVGRRTEPVRQLRCVMLNVTQVDELMFQL